jgi:cytochrome c
MRQLFLAVTLAITAATPALADQALATSKNCMSCHALDKKLVGPSYKDVAAKYAKDKGAVDMLAAKIVKGGAGVWGPVPMPANPQVNEADAKKLAAWVLAQVPDMNSSPVQDKESAAAQENLRHVRANVDANAARLAGLNKKHDKQYFVDRQVQIIKECTNVPDIGSCLQPRLNALQNE